MDTETQDRHWYRQAANGDREAASNLVRQHYPRLYAYLRRLSGNDADAADLTQETFRKTWESLHRFREASSLSTWLHRIAYCTWVDWLRKRRQPIAQPDRWWLDLPADFPSPFDRAETAERLVALWHQVDQLPEEERQAIHLRYGQELTLEQTADVLEMPLSTLKLRLKSALERLRRRIQEFQSPMAKPAA
jgi:RNA polymerase sigma-70 factor (ECF subfamily)